MTDSKEDNRLKMTDLFKVGDEVLWTKFPDLGSGVVSKVRTRTFDIRFRGYDEKGPFNEGDLNVVRKLTKLDKVLL